MGVLSGKRDRVDDSRFWTTVRIVVRPRPAPQPGAAGRWISSPIDQRENPRIFYLCKSGSLRGGHGMGEKALRIRALSLPLLAVLASALSTELRAQTCTLDPPLPTAIVDAATSTNFLPSGSDGQILVQKKYADSAIIRVFETSGPEPASWKVLSERPVLSVKPGPDKPSDGFTSTNSSVIRFVVPSLRNSFWEKRTFVVRICGQPSDGNAWAIVTARVSPPIWTKLISIGALLIIYAVFASAVWKIRGQPLALVTKYPSVAPQKVYSWFEHLDPVILTANSFNKGSIQKLQVLLFSFLVSGMVLSLVLTLGVLSDLSVTVAALLGISAVGAAVAQKTTTNRDRLGFENWAWLVGKHVVPINEEDRVGPQWSDLVMTNREFDIYKLQTLIFSLVVAVALLSSGEERLATFTVPETLLGILGLSQVVYVSGTLASAPATADLDDAITKLEAMEGKLQTVVSRNADTDGEGNLPEPLPKPPSPLPPLDARKANAV